VSAAAANAVTLDRMRDDVAARALFRYLREDEQSGLFCHSRLHFPGQ